MRAMRRVADALRGGRDAMKRRAWQKAYDFLRVADASRQSSGATAAAPPTWPYGLRTALAQDGGPVRVVTVDWREA